MEMIIFTKVSHMGKYFSLTVLMNNNDNINFVK